MDILNTDTQRTRGEKKIPFNKCWNIDVVLETIRTFFRLIYSLSFDSFGKQWKTGFFSWFFISNYMSIVVVASHYGFCWYAFPGKYLVGDKAANPNFQMAIVKCVSSHTTVITAHKMKTDSERCYLIFFRPFCMHSLSIVYTIFA